MRSDSAIIKLSAMTLLLAASWKVFAAGSAPNIGGVWSRVVAESAAPAPVPPLKPQYLKAYQSSRQRAAQFRSIPAGKLEPCKVVGMPTVMTAPKPLEILQTPGQVTILAEYMTQTRRIFMDTKLPALEEVNPGYMGYSVGKWNGDTLEVETIGVREDILYQGMPHSAKMKILEKIRLTAPDRLQDDMTIIDARTLTRPYQLSFTYQKEPGHRILEYACDHLAKGSAVTAR